MKTFRIHLLKRTDDGVKFVRDDAEHLVTLAAASDKYPEDSRFRRKILTMIKDRDMILLIGPIFLRDPRREFYFHENLLDAARREKMVTGYLPRGGGEIVFKGNSKRDSWEAEFGDYSGRFGVYDPRTLLHVKAIAKWLMMPVSFTWKQGISVSITGK